MSFIRLLVAANANSLPFLIPAQPAPGTVVVSCPTSNVPSLRGTGSSSRMRIGQKRRTRLFENGYGYFSTNRWKVIEEDL